MSEARILIVEDEAIEAMDLQGRLTRLGYPSPDVVHSGEDAVARARETRPDLVLMDIMLPGAIDGIQAAEQIRAFLDVPVIFVTAYADEKTLQRAKITEPYAYIVKPFQEKELHITIEMALYRHAAERKLRESEQRLRGTLDNMLEGCQIIDRSFRYVYLNDAVARHGRRAKEELLGHTMMEMYPGIEHTDVFARIARCMEGGDCGQLENEFTFPDGSKGWFDLRIEPVPEGVLILSVDITGRKQLEEDMKRYRERLEATVAERTVELARTNEELTMTVAKHVRAEEGLALRATILDNTREPIFLLNSAGDFCYANEAASQTYGYSREELLGMNIRQLLLPEDLSIIESRLQEVLRSGHLDVEWVHRRKDGTPLRVQVRHSLVKTIHGDSIVSVVRDISADLGVRSVLEQMPVMMWATDAGLKLTALVGAGLLSAGLGLGQNAEPALPRYLEESGFGRKPLATHRRALAGEHSSYRLKNTRTGITYLGRAGPVRDARGQLAGAATVLIETTAAVLPPPAHRATTQTGGP